MAKKVYIGGIQRFSTEDGPGIRTTVFLKGCTLACKWCHNPELINFDYTVLFQKQKCIGCTACLKSCPTGALSLSESGVNIDKTLCRHCGKCVDACCSGALHTSSVQMPLEEIMASVRRDREFYENSGGGITLSGGEILANPDMALRIAAAARDEGISVAIETSGYGNFEKLRALAELSDWVLFDIKHTDEARHRFYTGVSCALIQQNLQRLSEM
ncbi:MAG: glycyl-radical enzyme activating protein, partial [Oscillospiraceae bacterium]